MRFSKGKGYYGQFSILIIYNFRIFQKKKVMAVFLEVREAYENVSILILMNKLAKINILQLFIEFLRKIFINRKVIIKDYVSRSFSRSWPTSKAIPQSSVQVLFYMQFSPIILNSGLSYELRIEQCRRANKSQLFPI